jgi:integrase
MPRLGSKGSLERRGESWRGTWYRCGARFAQNLGPGTEEEARAKLASLIAACEESNAVRQEKATPSLSALLGEVLRHYRRHDRRSLVHVERHVAVLRQAFRGKRADELTRPRILAYVDGRKQEGYANGTINRELAALRLAYSLARKDGRIRPELCPVIDATVMLPETNVRRGFFEQQEYEGVLARLPVELQGPLTLGYWCGCRKEEILGLRWSQVDLAERLVFLERTKNGEDRTLPMNDELYAMFQQQWARRQEACPFVFHRGARRISDFRKAWCTACIGAGVGRWVEVEGGKPVYEGKIFHDLRRTGVRNLIRAGNPQSVAMLISGHLDARIFRRYNITDARDIAEAMRKVSEYEARKRQDRLLHSQTFPEAGKGEEISQSTNNSKVSIN